MSRDRAAYMREYRKRQRRETVMNTTMPAQAVRDLIDAQDRIRELEAEVTRLRRVLAEREHTGIGRVIPIAPSRPFAEFRPVPKPSQRK